MKLTPGRRAHLYARMAWNGDVNLEDEENWVASAQYAELDGKSYAESSVVAAVEGIQKTFGVEVVPDAIVAEKIAPTPENYDKIIEILVKIHDNWVKQNAKKYNRGNEEKSNKNLFQHLPTALIGLDEVAKDLLFLAPFLEDMGMDVGQMDLVPYGSFTASKKVAEAYQRYVERYKAAEGIKTQEDLLKHIDDCIEGAYEPLLPNDEMGVQRVAYMKFHEEVLKNSVCKKNEVEFEALPFEDEND